MSDAQGGAHLQQLADLVNRSVQVILEQYAANSRTVPGLDCTDEAQILFNQPIRDAVRVLESSCAQLCATVLPAGVIMVYQSCDMITPACIRVVLSGRIAEHLREGPKTITELSQISGMDAGRLRRVLRRLSLRHCFKEVSKDVFANNKLSVCLLPERTESGVIGCFADEVYDGFGRLSDVLTDPEWTSSTDKTKSAFARAHGVPFFQFLQNDHVRGPRFTVAMQGLSKLSGGPGVLIEPFPWEDLPQDSTFCDVGGGVGQVALALLHAKPHLRGIVQDQPSTIQRAEQFWRAQSPELLNRGRVQLVPIDFFAEAPIDGCAVYYLKHILHDWPDADCVEILRNVRKAMTLPHAKLLIRGYSHYQQLCQYITSEHPPDEIVLEYASAEAPFPLLPSYGAGALRAYNEDMNMMSTLNARERTLDEFVALGQEAGLKLVEVVDCGETQMVEFEAV